MRFGLAVLGLVLLWPRAGAAQDSLAPEIRTILAQGYNPGPPTQDFPRYLDMVARLYASRADLPAWLDGGKLSPVGTAAVAELLAAGEQGLVPADYDAHTLDSLAGALPLTSWSPEELAQFDLRLSLAVTRYLDELHGGRLRSMPFTPRWATADADLVTGIAKAIAGDSIGGLVAALQPQLAQYRNLRLHLARYRRLAAESAFVSLPAGSAVQPGQRYAHTAALRDRLIALGDLSAEAGAMTGDVYTGPVVDAVIHFQARHALNQDGVVGPATRAALNVPFADRVVQIELALERLRTLPPLGGQRLVVVNIPAFQLLTFDSVGGSGAPSLQMKVVIGKALDTRTPLLFEDLRYIEFRPYWNVPRSILVKEILPLMRRRPDYLRVHEMEIVGPQEVVVGDSVTPGLMRKLAAGQLRVRQRPGPQNQLGPAKFVIPNAANVYLHGTPETELFSRTRRDFSHGCIRVENPLGLAVWVLQNQLGWDQAAIEAAMMGEGTTRVTITTSIPVLVFYTTAVAAADGTIHFYQDIYGHDHQLLAALRAAAAA
jgi:murein L,D-transpeptidase YcbB/YkuD